MKQHNRWLALFLASTIIFSPIAEAKRAGGGKNHGMARQSMSQPARNSESTYRMPYNNNTENTNRSNTGKMIAAGVAGAAVGALAANALADDHAHQNIEQENTQATSHNTAENNQSSHFGWLFWVILAGLALVAYRFFSQRKVATAHQSNPYAPHSHNKSNHATFGNSNTNIFGQPVGSSQTQSNPFGVYTNNGNTLVDGSESAAFLRFARQRFNHIQSINNASNIQEIKRYLTPELYQSMYQDIIENNDENVAEFSNLNAMVVENTTENGRYIISVRFTGTVSEDLNRLPEPFTETWHFVKAVGSNDDWLVAGIQQV